MPASEEAYLEKKLQVPYQSKNKTTNQTKKKKKSTSCLFLAQWLLSFIYFKPQVNLPLTQQVTAVHTTFIQELKIPTAHKHILW